MTTTHSWLLWHTATYNKRKSRVKYKPIISTIVKPRQRTTRQTSALDIQQLPVSFQNRIPKLLQLEISSSITIFPLEPGFSFNTCCGKSSWVWQVHTGPISFLLTNQQCRKKTRVSSPVRKNVPLTLSILQLLPDSCSSLYNIAKYSPSVLDAKYVLGITH